MKSIFIKIICTILCATILLSISTPAAAEQSYHWYIKKRKGREPVFPKEAQQLKDYEALSAEASRMIRELYGEEPNGVNLLDKIRTEVTLRISNFRDTSVPHIADMLVKGNSMGITDMAKQLKTYRMASEEARGLANRLLEAQERNLDTMKAFLSMV